jgi:hypothetical protein
MKKHDAALIEAMANTIMKNFIPKNDAEHLLTFHFTIPSASNYKVTYEKDTKGKWNFITYEID